MNAAVKELSDFRREVASWLQAHKPADPGFLLPQSFMEVGSEEQLDFLREWQYRVWSAGYLGMAWPREYGGQGVDAVFLGDPGAVDEFDAMFLGAGAATRRWW